MSSWRATKAKRVQAALKRLGWSDKRLSGSRTLSRTGWPDVAFAFHDNEEIGPRMLARIAKVTGQNLKTYNPDPIPNSTWERRTPPAHRLEAYATR